MRKVTTLWYTFISNRLRGTKESDSFIKYAQLCIMTMEVPYPDNDGAGGQRSRPHGSTGRQRRLPEPPKVVETVHEVKTIPWEGWDAWFSQRRGSVIVKATLRWDTRYLTLTFTAEYNYQFSTGRARALFRVPRSRPSSATRRITSGAGAMSGWRLHVSIATRIRCQLKIFLVERLGWVKSQPLPHVGSCNLSLIFFDISVCK